MSSTAASLLRGPKSNSKNPKGDNIKRLSNTNGTSRNSNKGIERVPNGTYILPKPNGTYILPKKLQKLFDLDKEFRLFKELFSASRKRPVNDPGINLNYLKQMFYIILNNTRCGEGDFPKLSNDKVDTTTTKSIMTPFERLIKLYGNAGIPCPVVRLPNGCIVKNDDIRISELVEYFTSKDNSDGYTPTYRLLLCELFLLLTKDGTDEEELQAYAYMYLLNLVKDVPNVIQKHVLDQWFVTHHFLRKFFGNDHCIFRQHWENFYFHPNVAENLKIDFGFDDSDIEKIQEAITGLPDPNNSIGFLPYCYPWLFKNRYLVFAYSNPYKGDVKDGEIINYQFIVIDLKRYREGKDHFASYIKYCARRIAKEDGTEEIIPQYILVKYDNTSIPDAEIQFKLNPDGSLNVIRTKVFNRHIFPDSASFPFSDDEWVNDFLDWIGSDIIVQFFKDILSYANEFIRNRVKSLKNHNFEQSIEESSTNEHSEVVDDEFNRLPETDDSNVPNESVVYDESDKNPVPDESP